MPTLEADLQVQLSSAHLEAEGPTLSVAYVFVNWKVRLEAATCWWSCGVAGTG